MIYQMLSYPIDTQGICTMEKAHLIMELQIKQIASILLVGIERYLLEKEKDITTNDLQVQAMNGSVKRRILENK